MKPMYDFVVVGAGIAGSSFTRAARARGASVCLIANPSAPCASALSLGVMRRSWGKTPEDQDDASYALQRYLDLGAVLVTSARVSSYRNPDRVKNQEDWYAISPAKALMRPDICCGVASVAPGVCTLTDGSQLTAKHVVLAAGQGMKTLAPGVLHMATREAKRCYGAVATTTHQLPGAPSRLSVHLLRPFHHLMVLWDATHIRVGASTAQSAEGAIDEARAMVAQAEQMQTVPRYMGWKYAAAMRMPPTPGGATVLADGTVLFTGLYRTGYATAPATARRLLDAVEQQA